MYVLSMYVFLLVGRSFFVSILQFIGYIGYEFPYGVFGLSAGRPAARCVMVMLSITVCQVWVRISVPLYDSVRLFSGQCYRSVPCRGGYRSHPHCSAERGRLPLLPSRIKCSRRPKGSQIRIDRGHSANVK